MVDLNLRNRPTKYLSIYFDLFIATQRNSYMNEYGRCRRCLIRRTRSLGKLLLLLVLFSRVKSFPSPPVANKSGCSLRIECTALRPMSLPARLNMLGYNRLSMLSSATAEGLAPRTDLIPYSQEDPLASTMLWRGNRPATFRLYAASGQIRTRKSTTHLSLTTVFSVSGYRRRLPTGTDETGMEHAI